MKIDVTGTGIELINEVDIIETSRKWHGDLVSEKEDFTGWVNLPKHFDESLMKRIQDTAEEIKNKCDLLVVIGVGGSFLGAKAVIDALNGSRPGYPDIEFAGFNMSAAYLNKIVRKMDYRRTCLCVISKSGGTLEPLLTYSILKQRMFEKYGHDEACKRIYVITDAAKGQLRDEVNENGYTSFEVPSNIGGRYSVLSVVGLLPIAAAGHDVRTMIFGAKKIAESPEWKNSLLAYTVCRVALQRDGKMLEVFEFFEDNLRYFGEWLKQLFGESEGKNGKGAFPASLCFSRDLHSIGQFLQEGNQIFFETLISIEQSNYDFMIPASAGEPYVGKTLETINDCSQKGVVLAHKKGGIPITTIEVPKLDEFNLGKLIYFFEMSSALSAYNLGVNPFNQPGVEAYKRETKALVETL